MKTPAGARKIATLQFFCSLLFAWFVLALNLEEWPGRIRALNFTLASLGSFLAARGFWTGRSWAPVLSLAVAVAVGVTPLGFLATALEGGYPGPSYVIAGLGTLLQVSVVVWSLLILWPRRPGVTDDRSVH